LSALYCLIAFAIVYAARQKIRQSELPEDVPVNTAV
jgi:hypothetical protein